MSDEDLDLNYEEDELDSIVFTLPTGGGTYQYSQPTWNKDFSGEFTSEANIFDSVDTKEEVTSRVCSCGTNAVMGEIDPKFHSNWCDVYDQSTK